MHLYAAWRLGTIPLVADHLGRGWIWLVLAVLWASYVLSRLIRSWGLERLSGLLEWIGAMWVGVSLLLVVSLLLADLFAVVLRPGPLLAGRVRGGALALAAILSIVAAAQAARQPVLRDYEVALPDLPSQYDGLTLVVLSDLHLGGLIGEHWFSRVVDRVNELRPDILIVAGDLIEGRADRYEVFLPDIRRLSARLGVWGVTGNHEFYAGLSHSEDFFRQAGIPLLHDRWTPVGPGLTIAGIDDLTASRQTGRRAPPFAEVLRGRPPGAVVLVSHTPWRASEAAAAGIGLMLSGHTHGGQIWPFGWIERPIYPLMGGRYTIEGMTVIVCRGTGTWGPRMRLWRPGEFVRVTLRAASPPANRPPAGAS
jgi:predicted MPP superfamily phosphohydrolase